MTTTRTRSHSLAEGSLNWGSLPLKLFAGGNAKFWNPADLDFSRNQADWEALTDLEREWATRLCAQFIAGEEAVTQDIQPFMAAMRAEGRLGDEMYLTQFAFEEAKHTQVFRLWLDAVGVTDDLQVFLDDCPRTGRLLQRAAKSSTHLSTIRPRPPRGTELQRDRTLPWRRRRASARSARCVSRDRGRERPRGRRPVRMRQKPLLYILGLLDTPDAGRVSIESEAVSQLSDDELAQKRSKFIGFIFQFHFLMEDFTAQENVMIPMRKLGQLSDNKMRERAAGLLEAVGLGDKLRRPSRHLSGGEQQRVAIARALANDPRVILADEPTGSLETANSERAFELLQNLVQEGGKACSWPRTIPSLPKPAIGSMK